MSERPVTKARRCWRRSSASAGARSVNAARTSFSRAPPVVRAPRLAGKHEPSATIRWKSSTVTARNSGFPSAAISRRCWLRTQCRSAEGPSHRTTRTVWLQVAWVSAKRPARSPVVWPGLGHRPFAAITRARNPSGTPARYGVCADARLYTNSGDVPTVRPRSALTRAWRHVGGFGFGQWSKRPPS